MVYALATDYGCRIDRDPQISPGSLPLNHYSPFSQPSKRSSIAPWDDRGPDFSNYRKELAALGNHSGNVPLISQHPASPSPPWTSTNAPPANSFGSFFDDSTDDMAQLSPGYRPSSAQTDDMGFTEDARRPSIASATTVSSTGSKSSAGRGFHKKLQGFFGEEYPGDSRQNSETSLAKTEHGYTDSTMRLPKDKISFNHAATGNYNSRPVSPVSSRPRTPLPSSEVTPWEFQNKVGLYLIINRWPQRCGSDIVADTPFNCTVAVDLKLYLDDCVQWISSLFISV